MLSRASMLARDRCEVREVLDRQPRRVNHQRTSLENPLRTFVENLRQEPRRSSYSSDLQRRLFRED